METSDFLIETKEVEYKGEKFKVGFKRYAYVFSKFIINGEPSSNYVKNKDLLNIDVFKTEVKKAIEEHVNRKEANKNFKEWDGKLDN